MCFVYKRVKTSKPHKTIVLYGLLVLTLGDLSNTTLTLVNKLSLLLAHFNHDTVGIFQCDMPFAIPCAKARRLLWQIPTGGAGFLQVFGEW